MVVNKVRQVEPIYKSKKTTERNKEEREKFLQDYYLVRHPYRTSKPYSNRIFLYERPLEKSQGPTLIVKG